MAERTGLDRFRILHLLKIFEEYTDENEGITIEEIRTRLSGEMKAYLLKSPDKADYTVSVRTIYRDINYLREYGMNIKKAGAKTATKYYYSNRLFDLSEVKLLIDAVMCARFITQEESEKMMNKLFTLTRKGYKESLRRQVMTIDRVKTSNKNLLSSVDEIHKAISNNKKISFKYLEWNLDRELVERRGSKVYVISPWALTWDNQYYYMFGHDSDVDMIKKYRIDKMASVNISESDREGRDTFDQYGISKLSVNTFKMYDGEKETVRLRCKNELVGVILDRFGREKTPVIKKGDYFVTVREIIVSNQFFGWLAGLGPGVTIESPDEVAREYANYLRIICKAQEETCK